MILSEAVEWVLSKGDHFLDSDLIAKVEKKLGHKLRSDDILWIGRLQERRRAVNLARDIANDIEPYPPTESVEIKKGWRVALLHIAGILEYGGGDGDGESVLETWDDPIATRKPKRKES